jgi:hypothetical protein
MNTILLFVVVGIPLAWQLALASYVYFDTGRTPLDRTKWTAIALGVPLFGLFAYLLERTELEYDPESDPYADGAYNLQHDPDE